MKDKEEIEEEEEDKKREKIGEKLEERGCGEVKV